MTHMLALWGAALTTALALVVPACGDDAKPGVEVVPVVASFYPLAEIATRVGGDRVAVTNLTPVGVEPHDIELTSDGVDDLEDAAVVLYVGQGFQPAVAAVAARRGDHAVDLLDELDLVHGEGDGDDVDPHFWLDPQLMSSAVGVVAAALSAASPTDAATFQANAVAYRAGLAVLDAELAAGLSACDRTEIFTAHAAFFYLARRYGLIQMPIAGLSPEAEPDAGRLAELADEMKASGATTVFYEDLVSPRVAETLAREAGVETAPLSPIEGLSQQQFDAGKDYSSLMRDNLNSLRDALACR